MQVNLERCATAQSIIRPISSEAPVSARIAQTPNVRIELIRCTSRATVQWNVSRPRVSLMWVRDKGSNARVMITGQEADSVRAGRAKFWFFPEGAGAEGELTGVGGYDCVGIFVEPSFLPLVVRQTLCEPIAGFSHEALGCAFGEMARELTDTDEMLPIVAEGWAMQALGYFARAARDSQPRETTPGIGLAPWQLRRAKALYLADLSEHMPLKRVASACGLSVSHFTRAFKASTGTPPHRWLIKARIERARALLTEASTSLTDVAGICGFADQSHFARVFTRAVGTSPGAWRREHRV